MQGLSELWQDSTNTIMLVFEGYCQDKVTFAIILQVVISCKFRKDSARTVV